MQTVSVVMAVYNEEDLLPKALESIVDVGLKPDQVFIFDGAWRGGKNGAHTFADSLGPSTDRTMEIAKDFGAWFITCKQPWVSQEAKRTAMFDHVESQYILVMDADETLEGKFPKAFPDSHMNIMVRDTGPNDLPGIRGEWPNGDYCRDYKPELRFFKQSEDLECLYPGGYWSEGQWIQPYDGIESALPILEGLTMGHHASTRSDERIEEKIAYYQAEHPQRKAWQKALHKQLPR